jgi:hypothetical protein
MTTLPEEQRLAELGSSGGVDGYQELVRRLSRQSVTKHFDAYADIDWDAPGMAIDPADPLWRLEGFDPLGSTDWYRAQSPEVRSAIGLHRIAGNMKIGLQFESVLKRGLLEYAGTLGDGDPEFRYVYHEVIEEAQHSLMFAEFITRTGLKVTGMPWLMRIGAREVVKLGRRFPELFFVFVLGGEDPIDFVQRQALRHGRELPPVLERIIRIHVTEEARHLSFARAYLKHHVGSLGRLRRLGLAIGAPVILGVMSAVMLLPSSQLTQRFRIPLGVRWDAYRGNPEARQFRLDSLAKVRRLANELGLVTRSTRLVWRACGIWDATK